MSPYKIYDVIYGVFLLHEANTFRKHLRKASSIMSSSHRTHQRLGTMTAWNRVSDDQDDSYEVWLAARCSHEQPSPTQTIEEWQPTPRWFVSKAGYEIDVCGRAVSFIGRKTGNQTTPRTNFMNRDPASRLQCFITQQLQCIGAVRNPPSEAVRTSLSKTCYPIYPRSGKCKFPDDVMGGAHVDKR
jgi:hypothetical protein